MPAATYRPIIRLNRRGTVSPQVIRKAVEDIAKLRRNDPKAYEALIEKNAHRTVRIVPD